MTPTPAWEGSESSRSRTSSPGGDLHSPAPGPRASLLCRTACPSPSIRFAAGLCPLCSSVTGPQGRRYHVCPLPSPHCWPPGSGISMFPHALPVLCYWVCESLYLLSYHLLPVI